MLNKFFSVLFSGTQQTIETIRAGQADLKKQIKSAICLIEGIQASQARIDLVPVEIATVKNAYDQVMSDVDKIKISSECTGQSIDLIWAEIDAIKNTHAIELGLLKSEIDAIKAKPQAEIIPAEIEAKPEPIRATTKARTMTQPRARAIKNYTGGLCFENDFASVLKRALKHTAKRGILPVLSNVLIIAEGNTLTVHSTDLESGYTATLSTLKNWDKSTFLINRDVAETLSKSKAEISLDWDYSTSTVKVEAGSYKANFTSLSTDDFPRLPRFDAENLIISDSPELIPALIKSGKAQATDTAKSILTGTVLNRVGGYNIDVAATDGYRLFVENIASVNQAWDRDQSLIIPSTIIKRLSDYSKHTQLSVFQTDSHIMFELATGEKLYSRLIEGKYPDYNKILPKSFSHQISFNTAELKQAITGLKSAVNPQTKVFTFSFKKDGALQFETCNDSGPTAIRIDYKNLLKSDLPEISFNQCYFSDMIGMFDSETILIHMNSEIQPAIIRGVDNDKCQIMLMPIKP